MCWASRIADDSLPTIVHMDMLDANKLLTAIAEPSKYLDLGGISPHQTGRCAFPPMTLRLV
jgi:hypothetical protein